MYVVFTAVDHHHIHTVLRGSQKSPAAFPALYDLWVKDTFSPDLETSAGLEYWSKDDSDTQVYKSPLVECAWDRVKKVSTVKGLIFGRDLSSLIWWGTKKSPN